MGEVEDNVVRAWWCVVRSTQLTQGQAAGAARGPAPARRDHARRRKPQADGSAFAPRKPAARAPAGLPITVCARATPTA